MSIRLTTRKQGNVIVLDLSGKLTLGEGTYALREKVRELTEAGAKRLILNMAKVTYIDSSGLGELVAAYTTVTGSGGELKLLNLAKRGQDLLGFTKLYTVFETFEDEASAFGSFQAAMPAELQALQ